MRPKTILIISLIFLVSLITYARFSHLSFLEKLRNDSEKVKLDYVNFATRYPSSFIKKKKDFEFMLEWLHENEHDADYDFLDFGYNIKYDSIKNRFYIYSFGQDGKDDGMQYTPYNSNNYLVSYLNNTPILNGDLKKYLLNFFSSYDVVLLDIKNTDLDCPYNPEFFRDNTLFYNIKLFKGVKNLDDSSCKQVLADSLFEFCKNHLNTNFDNIDKMLLVSINRNKEIRIICPVNLESDYKSVLEKKLLLYFEMNKMNCFDSALFPLYVSK